MAMVFRRGTLSDTENYICFLDEIIAGMTHKEWFYVDPPNLIREMMSDGTMELWLAMDAERMAAVFAVVHPGMNAYNYGYDLGLCETELQQVVHMDTAAVHPDYRGLGLQSQMAEMAEKKLSGGKRILLSTVHPDNCFSLNSMLRLGYEVQLRVGKYGSERYILRKDIF